MEEQQLSPAESLNIIRAMIEKTKQDISDDSQYFLVWGWGAFFGCVGQFILKVVFQSPYHSAVWLVTFLCAFITIMLGRRDKKKENVKTYIGESMGFLWTGLGIAYLVICVIFSKLSWEYCYPFFMVLYGIGTFISGKILRFRAFVIGGLISFILAAVAVWFPFDYQMLFGAAALLASYIIPGHLLNAQYRRTKQQLNS